MGWIARTVTHHPVQCEHDDRPPDNQAYQLEGSNARRGHGSRIGRGGPLICTHSTITLQIHLVWSTPGRSGAMSRTG